MPFSNSVNMSFMLKPATTTEIDEVFYTRDNYAFAYSGEGILDGQPCSVLGLAPRVILRLVMRNSFPHAEAESRSWHNQMR